MSAQGPRRLGSNHADLKLLRRLVRQAKVRSSERAFVVEGPTLVAEALESSLSVRQVLIGVDKGGEPHYEPLLDMTATDDGSGSPDVVLVDEEVLRSILDPVAPRPVAAVVSTPEWSEDDLPPDRPVMIAVELRDPGNLGTIVRTAEAAGFGGVVVTEESVDVTNPKVVRASAGSVLRLPVVVGRSLAPAVAALDARHPAVAAVIDNDAEPYDEVDLRTAAIMIGNEPRGLSTAQAALARQRITIPMVGPAESLNVAAAGAVLAFEAARQRRRYRPDEIVGEPGSAGPMIDHDD